MRFLILISLFFASVSNASVVEAFDTKTTEFGRQNGRIKYIIEAKYLYKNYDKIKEKYNFFNRKLIANRYDYLRDGCFLAKNLKLNFYKSYRYNGKLIFERAKFHSKTDIIEARECSYKSNFLVCKGVKYIKNGKVVKIRIKKTIALDSLTLYKKTY